MPFQALVLDEDGFRDCTSRVAQIPTAEQIGVDSTVVSKLHLVHRIILLSDKWSCAELQISGKNLESVNFEARSIDS